MQPELKTKELEKESDNYSDYCIKNLLGIFFKSRFFLILSFLALFLKKNSFIPSKKAQEVEFGFKRCNSDSQALQNQQIYGECYWAFNGKKSLY